MAEAKRLGASRAAMERMRRIHQFVQSNEYPNCTKVAKESEVSKGTVKRDAQFMKERVKLQIGFGVPRIGCWYAERVSVESVGAL
jgi:hypothetical protein